MCKIKINYNINYYALYLLNKSSSRTLRNINRIGPILSERIFEKKLSHEFTSFDQVMQIKQIGPSICANIKNYFMNLAK